MPSPFLAVPETEWVASNDLAFALRDRYPVTDGHTLVIPRREIATWFDATPDERAAIFALIDDVKRALDTTHHPDGYNVGFNAGEAAGQTVMHLHVHVIPRYRGDVDDPRGGVRHVIPARGNYLASAPLSTGGPADPFLRHLAPLFAAATDIAILAAFDRVRWEVKDWRPGETAFVLARAPGDAGLGAGCERRCSRQRRVAGRGKGEPVAVSGRDTSGINAVD